MHSIITIITLENMSDADLLALYDALWHALIQSDIGSSDRRNIMASMKNIEIVMHSRRTLWPAPGR